VEGRDLRSTVNEIKRTIADNVDLPEECHVEYGGQFESAENASRILLVTSLLSVIVIFVLLYGQFRNATQSAIVLINLPLALIGGVMALVVTGGELSIPAIIGFISLFGIATRNGMLLIDQYNGLVSKGMDVHTAVLNGSLDRLTPILMTAFTSALALVPLSVGSELPGNEIQSPMAKVMLGGLVSSTFLNMFVVPLIYRKK
jgi:Cu/Ag efflux pump CusA